MAKDLDRIWQKGFDRIWQKDSVRVYQNISWWFLCWQHLTMMIDVMMSVLIHIYWWFGVLALCSLIGCMWLTFLQCALILLFWYTCPPCPPKPVARPCLAQTVLSLLLKDVGVVLLVYWSWYWWPFSPQQYENVESLRVPSNWASAWIPSYLSDNKDAWGMWVCSNMW